LGVKVNSKIRTVRELTGEPGSGLFGDVRRMIVEDQLNRRLGPIGGVEKLEEFDEFAAAMAILDQRMNLSGEEVDAGQADRAVTLIFMPTGEGRMDARFGRQIPGRCGDRLGPRLLVVGDERHRIARPFLLSAIFSAKREDRWVVIILKYQRLRR
jgi:hypothetical protein